MKYQTRSVKLYLDFRFSEPHSLRDIAGLAERQHPELMKDGWVAEIPRTYDSKKHHKRSHGLMDSYDITFVKWEDGK